MQDVLTWAASTYPDRRVKGLALILDDGEEVRVPVPGKAFATAMASIPKVNEVDEAILTYLRRRREFLKAEQIRNGLNDDDKICYGQSTVERSLARMRKDGRVIYQSGKGYGMDDW